MGQAVVSPRKFADLLAEGRAAQKPILLPGVYDALSARLAAAAGFPAVYVSGAGLANSRLGVPDIGLVSSDQLVDHVASIADAVDVALVVDADTGFGNAINVMRSVRQLERAGASAIQLEDQVFPKRCGHFTHKAVIPTEEMEGKLKAALDARRCDDTLIIARTDARAVLGFEAALERGERYRAVGADIIFIEAPSSAAELRTICDRIDASHVANMVEGGATPILPLDELGAMGFSLVLYANAALRSAQRAVTRAFAELQSSGISTRLLESMATWEERQHAVGKPAFDALEERYTPVNPVEAADLRIHGGTVVLPGGAQAADVLVAGGRIAAIVAPDAGVEARDTLDASGHHVLPGVVDAHVHLGEDITLPRSPEEVRPETAAAAAGGVTSLIAYLMSPEPYDEVVSIAREVMERDSRVDFGFHFCISTREQLEAVPHYINDLGVSSFKFFMNFRTDEGQRLGLPGNDDGFLFELLEAAAAHGGVVNPHAENADLIRLGNRRGSIEEPGSPMERWNRRAPGWVEAEALQRVAFWARQAGADVHAVHVTNAASLEVLRAARAHSPGISIETCPHYLTLDTASSLGPEGKVNPPLRSPADREALWEAVAAGEIDTIGSDHVPRHGRFKSGGLASASPGFPGLQQLLPLVLTEGHVRRGIPLERIVQLVSTAPARIFGLGSRKGAIRPGADADLVIVDLARGSTISAATELASAGFTPWEGTRTAVHVVRTLMRGRTVYADGRPTGDARGAFLPRHRSSVRHPSEFLRES